MTVQHGKIHACLDVLEVGLKQPAQCAQNVQENWSALYCRCKLLNLVANKAFPLVTVSQKKPLSFTCVRLLRLWSVCVSSKA